NEPGLALDEKAPEHLLRVGADAGLDEMAREVGARDQLVVAGVTQRPFVRSRDADLGELVGHLSRALAAAAARRDEALAQRGVVAVDAEADDVDRRADEGHRDLDSSEVRKRE